MLPIVDTHQHMWDLREFSLPWLTDVEMLNKSHDMDDYCEASRGCGINQTVYMEVDVEPTQRGREVDYVSDFCSRSDNPMVAAVVSGSPAEEGFLDIVKVVEEALCKIHYGNLSVIEDIYSCDKESRERTLEILSNL